ncbi:MAG: hypothetical protein COC19_04275 [SAR86 cluster bacterium]|uniref:Carboxylic ester hydrolase n=1 Tax=SAR86 cluster bacterium TaxID=2030880 RepID=A0A2A4MND9_9GAMM|nr:MAG: hypothetical protein COC19_04275 [SAR86 cluster bacterium]
MLIFEVLFILLTLLVLTKLNWSSLVPVPAKPLLIIAVIAALLHLLVEGLRWQMLPAYCVFFGVAAFYLKNTQAQWFVRVLGAAMGTILLSVSILLISQFPIMALPAPQGQYAVGTFSMTLLDEQRLERYAPQFNREVPLQVWYSANKQDSQGLPRQSLFPQLYSGDYDLISFLFGYLKRLKTHSVINAPIAQAPTAEAEAGTFPLIVFNHGLFFMSDHSPQLMEHLASNGYIVVSITHPFESLKVSLPNMGTRLFSMEYPEDVGFTQDQLSDGGIGDKIGNIIGLEHSSLMAALYQQMDNYNAAKPADQQGVISAALEMQSLQILGELLTEDNLAAFFQIRTRVRNRSVAYWVEDIQFVLDQLPLLDAPIENFSVSFDISRIGALGYSYGGAAVGEFCKLDFRCAAGSNIDGTQFGANWNKPVQSPFLLINSDSNPQGNNYAYYPAKENFFDIYIPNTLHQDLMDFLVVFPVLRTLGMSGTMQYQELANIVKDLELAFLDEFLKGKAGGLKEAIEKHSETVMVYALSK